MIKKDKILLYAITDRKSIGKRNYISAIKEAVEAGVDIIQLREKELDKESLKDLGRKIKEICFGKAIFIINDDVGLAKELDSDGLHLGQSDMSLSEARAILGKDKIIGITAKTIDQAKEAKEKGADYLGCGAIFPTLTKPDAKALSKEELDEISKLVDIPVYAIGGLDEGNISCLKGISISGVAVSSAIFGAEDIKSAAKRLKEVIEREL